jgi:Pyruvate/2-oxoglutarate dehydrogenase complex, dehydrogenase (E1) component, eukaryotic type, alpha subunit
MVMTFFAVYKATKDAIEASHEKPTIIECVTYRMSMHTTSDDPTKYREDAEVEAWKQKDPINRLKKYLYSRNLWDDNKENSMKEEQTKAIEDAVKKAEEFKPDPKSMFEHVYSFMPEVLKEEYDESIRENFWQE